MIFVVLNVDKYVIFYTYYLSVPFYFHNYDIEILNK